MSAPAGGEARPERVETLLAIVRSLIDEERRRRRRAPTMRARRHIVYRRTLSRRNRRMRCMGWFNDLYVAEYKGNRIEVEARDTAPGFGLKSFLNTSYEFRLVVNGAVVDTGGTFT